MGTAAPPARSLSAAARPTAGAGAGVSACFRVDVATISAGYRAPLCSNFGPPALMVLLCVAVGGGSSPALRHRRRSLVMNSDELGAELSLIG